MAAEYIDINVSSIVTEYYETIFTRDFPYPVGELAHSVHSHSLCIYDQPRVTGLTTYSVAFLPRNCIQSQTYGL